MTPSICCMVVAVVDPWIDNGSDVAPFDTEEQARAAEGRVAFWPPRV